MVGAPEFEEDVSTDGDATEDGATDSLLLTDGGNISNMLLHGGNTISCSGLPVSPQVGENHPIALRDGPSHRQPHLMAGGEGMQQDQPCPFTEYRVMASDIIERQFHV